MDSWEGGENAEKGRRSVGGKGPEGRTLTTHYSWFQAGDGYQPLPHIPYSCPPSLLPNLPPPPPSRLQVFPYVLEIAMLAIFPTLMGVSLGNAYAADIIQKDFNFIVNSALAGITLISIIVTYPLGVQHVQEQV